MADEVQVDDCDSGWRGASGTSLAGARSSEPTPCSWSGVVWRGVEWKTLHSFLMFPLSCFQ